MSLCVLARHITLVVNTSAECAALLNTSDSKALTVRGEVGRSRYDRTHQPAWFDELDFPPNRNSLFPSVI